MISVFDREENIVGKGENAGYHLPQTRQKVSLCSNGFTEQSYTL